MAYTAVTASQFKTAKPQFASVADATVDVYLALGARVVDASWTEGDYQTAIISYACHLMTLDGLGTDEQSKSEANGTAQFQTIKSADLTLTRFAREATGSSYGDWLASTACGRFFTILADMNRSGPRILYGGCNPVSGYAKDAPLTMGWPLAFYP